MRKILLAMLLVLALSTPAMAVLTLDLNVSNTQGSGLYGQLLFTPSGDLKTVTVSANFNSSIFNTAGSTNFGVQDVYLNLYSVSGVSFTTIAPGWTSATDPPTNNLKGDGFGFFTFTAGNGGGDRYPINAMNGSTDLFTLTFSNAVDVNTFLTLNDKGVYAAMHLAGFAPITLPNGETINSAWLAATPIPGTVYLFVGGLAGLVGITRWRRRK